MSVSDRLELPDLFHAADATSLAGQRHFIRSTRAQLWLLIIIAAGAGGIVISVGIASMSQA